MAKFIGILAASVGGGLVLGASIRLGEAMGASAIKAHRRALPPEAPGADDPSGPEHQAANPGGPRQEPEGYGTAGESACPTNSLADPRVTARLDRLEAKLTKVSSGRAAPAGEPGPEWRTALASLAARMDRQQTDVETIRSQVAKATRAMNKVGGMAGDLRHEIEQKVSQDLDRRLAAIEESFQMSMAAANRETTDAMVASIETRVAPRISRLETDIAGQSAAVSELRECALQSERSIQRLLGVLERVVNPPRQAGGDELFGSEEGKLAAVGGPIQEDPAGGRGDARRAASFRTLRPGTLSQII